MKKLNQIFAIVAVATALCGVNNAMAQGQGRGNFDPEQMRQRMMDRYREVLEVKGDDEWKLISERVKKVMDARAEIGFAGMGFGGGFGGRPGGDRGGDRNTNSNNGSGGETRRRFGPEPSAEEQALQKAIEAKAPADEIKTKLAKVREVRKAKEAKLEQAQEELKKVLSIKQEAAAVMNGLLK